MKNLSTTIGLIVIGAVAAFFTHAAEKTKITFLHINDVYEIEANRDGVGGWHLSKH